MTGVDFTFTEVNNPRTITKYWWKCSNEDLPDTILSVTNNLRTQQELRNQRNLRNMRLYGNLTYTGLTKESYNRTEDALRTQNRLTLNIVRSMCDTVTAKVSKTRPLPTFLTDGGDTGKKMQAKKLEKYIKGHFHHLKAYDVGPQVFRDSTIFGSGFLKPYLDVEDLPEGKKKVRLCADRIFPNEILVDEIEAFYGEPRSLFQERHYPREVLVGMFPDQETYIMEAKEDRREGVTVQDIADTVRVVEGWHLPSYRGADDGRHVLIIDGKALIDEEYTRDCFPFVEYHWSDSIIGYWGTGLTDELVGLQIEINKILRTIQRAMHLLSIPKVFVEAGSKVVKQHFNNEIGGIITFSGVKPTVEAFNAVSPELFAHLDRLYQRAYEITGISQLAAQSKKPDGLDSGKALRTFNDIESERFIDRGQKYERFFMDLAEHIIDLSREAQEIDPSFGVLSPDKKDVEEIKFKDVNLEKDKFVMKMFPRSALSELPAARLQEVQEMLQAGFIDRETGIQLLDFPDLESAYKRLTAASDDIDYVVDKILQKGEFNPPEPFMDLQLGITRMRAAYLRAKDEKVPESKLKLFRQWMLQAKALIDQANAALIQQQAPLPTAVPEAAPRSDLLPVNTPANAALPV